MDKRLCPRCGKVVTRWGRTFCGRRCAQTRDLPSKVCVQCGREFRKNAEYSYAVWEAIRFCSRACMGAARRKTTRVCVGCGATFAPTDSRRRLASKFCSQGCYFEELRRRFPIDRPTEATDFNRRMRRALRERASGRCERCGATENLERDHIVPRREGGTGSLANGQILCHQCHLAKTLSERA
ncbi:MAG: HNH endonuclease signature motif containing protein [Planctomycetota bacterium]